MTNKYTPAPWSVRWIQKSNHHAQFRVEHFSINETEPNLKLIAAAPDLLEALIACDEAMEYISECDIPLCLPQKVKNANAKATGETE